MKFHPALAALLLASGVGSAAAAPIYRCGSTYSQTPCPGGSVVEATDTRSAAQRAEARRIADNERKKAEEMERERKQKEKEQADAKRAATPAPAAAPASGPEVVSAPDDQRLRVKNPDRNPPAAGARPRPTPH
jgi:hypothetical protein